MNRDDIRKDIVIRNYDYIFKIAGDSIGLRNLTYKDYLELDKRNKDGEEKQRKIEEFIENHLQNPMTAQNRALFNPALDSINRNLEKKDRPFDIYSFLNLGKRLFSKEKEEEKTEINDDLEELNRLAEGEALETKEETQLTVEEELGTPEKYDVKKIKQGVDGFFQRFSMGKTARKASKDEKKDKKGFFRGLGSKMSNALKNPLVNGSLAAVSIIGGIGIPSVLWFAAVAAGTLATPAAIAMIGVFGAGLVGTGYFGSKIVVSLINSLKNKKNIQTNSKEMTEALKEIEKNSPKEEKSETKEVTKKEENKTEVKENVDSVEVTKEEPGNYNTIKVTPKHLLEKQDYLLHLYESLSLDEEDIKHVRDADLDLMRRNFEALYRSRVEKVKENKEQLSPEKLEIEKTKVGIMSSFLNLNTNALRSNWKNFREYFKKVVDVELENNKKLYSSEMFNHADENYQISMEVMESTQNKIANTFESVENKDMLLRLNSLYAKKMNDAKEEISDGLTKLTNEMVHYYDEISRYRSGGYESAAEAIESKKDEAKLDDRKNAIRQELDYINRIQNFQKNRNKKVMDDLDDEMPEALAYEDEEETKTR